MEKYSAQATLFGMVETNSQLWNDWNEKVAKINYEKNVDEVCVSFKKTYKNNNSQILRLPSCQPFVWTSSNSVFLTPSKIMIFPLEIW